MIYFFNSCSQDLFLHQKTSLQFRGNQFRTGKILDFREDFNEVFESALVFRLVQSIQRNFISTKPTSVFIFINLNIQCMKSVQNSRCSGSCLIFIGASLERKLVMEPHYTGAAHFIQAKSEELEDQKIQKHKNYTSPTHGAVQTLSNMLNDGINEQHLSTSAAT